MPRDNIDRPKKYIPNLNSPSTIIDRISVEVVKFVHENIRLADLECAEEEASKEAVEAIRARILSQNEIIAALGDELKITLRQLFNSSSYETYGETRTFI